MIAQPAPALGGLDYLLFDPAPFAFPRPQVPLLAPLNLSALHWRRTGRDPVPAWAPDGRLYTRARYAMLDAFRLSGVGPAGALLAPAFHCRTMLDPALALNAPVQLFALLADLSPDLGDVERQLREAKVPVKAVVMAHYFGMAQDLAPLAALCRQWGARLIEDCAHGLPLKAAQARMGRMGHWCVSSPYKFFACEDGGALWSGTGEPWPALASLRRPSVRKQLQQMRWLRARGQVPARPASRALDMAISSPQSLALASACHQSGPSADFDLRSADQACAPLSRWIIGHSDIDALLRQRRKNFAAWSQALRGLDGLQTPWASMGPQDTPYAFPVLIDQPAPRFAALKRAGFPIWRWDSLASSHCATSASYRQRLFQLPCHQALTPAQMDWMIDTLRGVLAAPLRAAVP